MSRTKRRGAQTVEPAPDEWDELQSDYVLVLNPDDGHGDSAGLGDADQYQRRWF